MSTGDNMDNEVLEKSKTEKSDKKSSQLIAFRADTETNEMIRILEGMKGESKTDILLQAVKTSFNAIVVKKLLEDLEVSITKIFEGAEYAGCFPFDYLMESKGEEKLKASYNKVTAFFELPEFKKTTKGNVIFSFESALEVEITVKTMHFVELEFSKILLFESIDKIESDVFKKIYEVAAKKGLSVESKSFDKKSTRINVVLKNLFEISEISEKKWPKRIENDLMRMKDALLDFKEFEERHKELKKNNNHACDKPKTAEVIGQQSSET